MNQCLVNFIKSNNSKKVFFCADKPRQDFHSQVGLALASNKAGLFEQAYNSYQAALQLASDDSDRSHVLAAMATIAYKLQVKYCWGLSFNMVIC
jgi:hypothetical protein